MNKIDLNEGNSQNTPKRENVDAVSDDKTRPSNNSMPSNSPLNNKPKAQKPGVLFFVEHGPLLAFVLAYVYDDYNIITASAVFAATTVLALIIARIFSVTVPKLVIFSAIAVSFFGAMTYFLNDERFIKIKPTVVYCVLGSWLLWAKVTGGAGLRSILEAKIQLQNEGWHKLNLRWMIFFFAMAGLNEIIWRNFSTELWVSFKFFGFLPLTFIFTFLQISLIKEYHLGNKNENHS